MGINILSLLTFLVLSTKETAVNKINTPNSVFILKNEQNVLLNVPFVHQIEDLPEEEKPLVRTTACGPAALTMLFRFHGIETTLNEVISVLPNSVYVKGQRFYNLYEGPKYFSMRSIRIENSPQDLFDTLQEGKPVIMNVQNYDGITGHALVVVGILHYKDNSAASLIVHDPFVGPYRQFPYNTESIIEQPEGFLNYIGNLDPFYIEKSNLLVLK